MADPTAVAEAPVATPSPGLAESSGQGAVATPSPATNPTTADATPSAQAAPPASTPKYRFKDQTEAERAHSELQSRYSRVGDPEQAAQMLGLLRSLQGDPEFVQWAKARLAKQEAGAGDPETVKALQIVESVAERKAREMIQPYAAHAAAVNQAAVMQAMTQKYPEWREYEAAMGEVLRQGVQSGYIAKTASLSLPFLESLYHAATARDPEFAAKAYQKKLAKLQATSTQATPGPAPSAVASGPVNNMRDALALAKKQIGMA